MSSKKILSGPGKLSGVSRNGPQNTKQPYNQCQARENVCNTTRHRPSYKNPEKWPKNLSGIFSKNVLKISGFTSKNPIKTPKNLKKSYNIKKKFG